jgi:pimeloyl-ACP methyl ester carboxylesterase
VQTHVANHGATGSGSYKLEYRLSADQSITTADPLLATTSHFSLAAGATLNVSKSVSIPAATAKGSYYVGVRIVPGAADAIAANNAKAEAVATPVYWATLSGKAEYNGDARNVSIRSHLGGKTPIFDDRPTWIVVHGHYSSPSTSYIDALAEALDGYRSTDQVLVLDWSGPAALSASRSENYFIPIGTWAAGALGAYGLAPAELNLVGHSWGAYVAAETAERVPGAKVNSIVALDPGIDAAGGYNPTAAGQVNFARNASMSWSFYAPEGLRGTPVTARTAHEAFVVTGANHFGLVRVFTDLVRMNYDGRQSAGATAKVAAQFKLSRLLAPARNTAWVINSYDPSGRRTTGGAFEAVIGANALATGVKTLRYVASATQAEIVVTV